MRVLSGPLTGSVVPIYGRLEIGRASSADIQLVSTEVSRSHAVLLVRPDGHVLVDLKSTNGTWLRGVRITEQPLAVGDRIRIGDSELAYEVSDAELAEASEATHDRSQRTRRTTERVDLQRIARSHGERYAENAGRTTVSNPDGTPYQGNLLADILVYRNLRLKAVRDGEVPPDMKARFDELEVALRRPGTDAERGAFHRFTVDTEGLLIWEADPKNVDEVKVHEIAVDGAIVTAPLEREIEVDSTCWLTIPALGGDGRVVLNGRVVWHRGGEAGLVFSTSHAPRDDAGVPQARPRENTVMITRVVD